MSAAEETSETSGRMTIGLTFGNTNSSIAFTGPDGKAEVIANEEGDRQIPTILSYVGGEEYQGTQAKAQLVRNPRNTVAFFRDFLGKEFKDVDPRACQQSAHPEPRDGGKTACFQVQEGESDEKSCLSVEEIAIRHIRRLRQSAADYLGREVNSAVLTIPSDSSDAQKAAVCAVAAKAGIEIIQTIPEPISALLAHDAKQQLSGESDPASQDKIVLVADLGGIRSDVAVVANRNGMYTTLATAHDYELGGKALDEVLIEYAAKEFLKKNKTAADPRSNERSLAKLTLEAEAVKKSLSLGQSASFSIESLVDGIDFSLTVNRTRYELLANKVFMSFTRLIEAAVKKANLDILDVDHILLSGGTAHTPKIASNLRSHFPESTTVTAPSTTATAVNPSELSARGAAIQASLVSEFEQSDIESSIEPVVTVAPHTSASVGLATENGFTVIVPENTPVPARRTAQISVAAGGDVLLRLAEGSREIKVTTEEKPASNGAKDEDDSDEDDSDDEPEEIREKVFKAGKTLAEAGVRGVKKDGKVEVQVNIAADLTITFVAREVGGKGGVRGTVAA